MRWIAAFSTFLLCIGILGEVFDPFLRGAGFDPLLLWALYSIISLVPSSLILILWELDEIKKKIR